MPSSRVSITQGSAGPARPNVARASCPCVDNVASRHLTRPEGPKERLAGRRKPPEPISPNLLEKAPTGRKNISHLQIHPPSSTPCPSMALYGSYPDTKTIPWRGTMGGAHAAHSTKQTKALSSPRRRGSMNTSHHSNPEEHQHVALVHYSAPNLPSCPPQGSPGRARHSVAQAGMLVLSKGHAQQTMSLSNLSHLSHLSPRSHFPNYIVIFSNATLSAQSASPSRNCIKHPATTSNGSFLSAD